MKVTVDTQTLTEQYLMCELFLQQFSFLSYNFRTHTELTTWSDLPAMLCCSLVP